MKAEGQIESIKKVLESDNSMELKRTLEMLIRKMDAIELSLEKKIEKKFDEQSEYLKSLIEKSDSPRPFPPEEPRFYS